MVNDTMEKLRHRKIGKLNTFVRILSNKPIVKFRRVTRAVLKLIQVCKVCQETLTLQVKSEPWYAFLDALVSTGDNHNQKRSHPHSPFMAAVLNDNRELEELTFDLCDFKKKDPREELVMPDEVRGILSLLPSHRAPDQIAKVIRCMSGLFAEFNKYPFVTQKQICQKAFYDKYRQNRVIAKKGQDPGGIYYVLSGVLIEELDAGRQPRQIHAGTVFGENDLTHGNKRQHTILTGTKTTELLYLYRQDYRVIFGMLENTNDPKNLDICKQNTVLQHFPMSRLLETPGMWRVVKYKYGQLIAKDSNDVDWIYVIKAGEARVLKYAELLESSVQAGRRKNVQAMNSGKYQQRKIFRFVETKGFIKSSYSTQKYHPVTRKAVSAVPEASHPPILSHSSHRQAALMCIPGPQITRGYRKSVKFGKTPVHGELPHLPIVSKKSDGWLIELLHQKQNEDSQDSLQLPTTKLEDFAMNSIVSIITKKSQDDAQKDSGNGKLEKSDNSRTSESEDLILEKTMNANSMLKTYQQVLESVTSLDVFRNTDTESDVLRYAHRESETVLFHGSDREPDVLRNSDIESTAVLFHGPDREPDVLRNSDIESTAVLFHGPNRESHVLRNSDIESAVLVHGPDREPDVLRNSDLESTAVLFHGPDRGPDVLRNTYTESAAVLVHGLDREPDVLRNTDTESASVLAHGPDREPDVLRNTDTESASVLAHGPDREPDVLRNTDTESAAVLVHGPDREQDVLRNTYTESAAVLVHGPESHSKKYLKISSRSHPSHSSHMKDKEGTGGVTKFLNFKTTPQYAQKYSSPKVLQIDNQIHRAFVKIETLRHGQTFGLRACLDPDERGPSVSLVSSECEVLQINKKFFMKHCDDTVYSLIRLKTNPFPSQDELSDGLAASMQWEEHKQQILIDLLQRFRRLKR